VGWNIGANDTANCIGTIVGCGLLSYRKAALMTAVCVIIGAILQGQHVTHTIGKGIVKTDLNSLAVAIALICSGTFVTLATFLKIPTSTSQAVVGGVMGIGLAVRADLNYDKLLAIGQSWVLCPLLVMLLAFLMAHLLGVVIRLLPAKGILMQQTMGYLSIGSAAYVAYSMGANNAGNAIGPLIHLKHLSIPMLLTLGGLAIAAGGISYGQKVAETIGKGITPLNIPGALAAQVAAAVGMHLFSLLGIPVSTSSAIVGAVVGVGLTKGTKTIRPQTLLVIVCGWVLTPAMAALASFSLYCVIRPLFYT
jgi:PiT family inorganic phosphate transporter